MAVDFNSPVTVDVHAFARTRERLVMVVPNFDVVWTSTVTFPSKIYGFTIGELYM